MRRRLRLTLAAATTLVATLAFTTSLAIPEQSRRIVSLAPSTTETLFALGAGAEVVGVSQYCDYPEAATRLPKVGSFLTPNVEVIAGLRPTLVIALETSSNLREVRALEAVGYPTLVVKADTLEDIRTMILTVGERIGRAREAAELVGSIQSHIDSVRARLKNATRREVLMVVGHQPMVAVGPGTYLDELLNIAGGINIAGRAAQAWPRLSIEYVIAMRPEVILDGEMGTDPGSPGSFWAQYESIPAVRNHRVFGYPDGLMLHAGPRVAESLDVLAATIHPEAPAKP